MTFSTFSGENIQINVPLQVETVEEIEDDVQKYSLSLIRVAMDFMLFCEVIKAGDIKMMCAYLNIYSSFHWLDII